MEYIEEMKKYAEKCQSILKENSDAINTCKKIIDLETQHILITHPMLDEVSRLAYGVNCFYDIDDIEDLKDDVAKITKLLDDFLANKFHPTTKCLLCGYGTFNQKGEQTKGFSAKISFANGQVSIEPTNNKELHSTLSKIASKISKNQTDEWYLYNFALMLPKTWNEFELLGYSIFDTLSES